jgi:hypothetical protein
VECSRVVCAVLREGKIGTKLRLADLDQGTMMNLPRASVRTLGRDALVLVAAAVAENVRESRPALAQPWRDPPQPVTEARQVHIHPQLSSSIMALRAAEWHKLPTNLTELCINTTLRCGQSFRYMTSLKLESAQLTRDQMAQVR